MSVTQQPVQVTTTVADDDLELIYMESRARASRIDLIYTAPWWFIIIIGGFNFDRHSDLYQ